MTLQNLGSVENIIINTGNILSLNDITKKSVQNPSEELLEAVNITIKEFKNGTVPSQPDQPLIVSRPNEDLAAKITEHGTGELKIVYKIFLTSDDPSHLNDAIEKAFITLNVTNIDHVVVAFNKKRDNINDIKAIWTALEENVSQNRVTNIGIADIDEETFRDLYAWSSIKPNILQINLATCCVVPGTLQTFCKDNDVQLLTHSDPLDILPDTLLEAILGKPFLLKWVVRFSVHIKCRGVLIIKGYLLSLVNAKLLKVKEVK